MNRSVFILLFFCCSFGVLAQEDPASIIKEAKSLKDQRQFKKADSVLNRVNNRNIQEGELELLISYVRLKAWLKGRLEDSDSSIQYYNRLIELQSERGNKNEVRDAYRSISHQYVESANLDSALRYIELSIKADSIEGKMKHLIGDMRQKADIYSFFGYTTEALNTLELTLEIAERSGDLDAKQKSLLRIGRIYSQVGEYEESERYMNLSTEISQRLDNGSELYVNYRKTILYTRWEKFEMADSVNQWALVNCDSLEKPAFYGQLLLQGGRIALGTDNFRLAVSYADRAFEQNKIRPTNALTARAYLFRAKIYTYSEDYTTANFWMDSALFYSRNMREPLVQIQMFHQKSVISYLLGDVETYEEYQLKYNGIKDSVIGADNLRAVTTHEMKMIREENELNAEELTTELENTEQAKKWFQSIFIISLLIGGGLILFAILFFKSRIRRREHLLSAKTQSLNEELKSKDQQIEKMKEAGVVIKEDLPEHFEPLSKREKEVFELLVQGLPDKEIGEKLFISLPTVRTHIRHIYEKFHISSRMEAKDISLKYKVLES